MYKMSFVSNKKLENILSIVLLWQKRSSRAYYRVSDTAQNFFMSKKLSFIAVKYFIVLLLNPFLKFSGTF